jgi:hypothetical protein
LQEALIAKVKHLSLGNNVLDAADSNRDHCLWRDKCISSSQLNRPIWTKMTLSPSAKL